VRYLNNAGTTWPKAPGVLEAAKGHLGMPPEERPEAFDAIHARLCAELVVTRPERLLLTASCSSALAVAISDLPWREGDRVLCSSLEHHALARPLMKLQSDRGVLVERSPYQPGRPFDLDWARAELRRGGVRLVACTAASNVTGELLPTKDIAALAHEFGALFLMDAAQTAGVLPLSMADCGADIVTLAGHKGPLAPWGIGVLWAAPSVVFESPWAVCEISEDGTAVAPACSAFPSYCDFGSVNLSAAAGLAVGFEWTQANPQAWVQARTLARDLARAVVDIEGARLLGGAEVERTATVALIIDGLPLEQTELAFADRDIIVRAGSHCAPWALETLGQPKGALRISFGPFSDAEDLDAVVKAIETLRH
jgi:selenocysteine lyase/cysteine desulfurase